MLGVVKKLRSLVLGEEEDEDSSPSIYFAKGRKEDVAPVLSAATRVPERRFFNGKVTSATEDSGMVNGQVFFEFSSVIGGLRPKV